MKGKLQLCLISFTGLPLVTMSLSSCSNSNGIVVANFESYMSTDLMNEITKQYDTQFLYYGTNEDIESKFQKNYDVAIPSTYEVITLLQKGLLGRIDWKLFGLKDTEGNDIKNGTDALCLFSDSAKAVIESVTKNYPDLFHPDDPNDPTNLLDYAIPYFLQTFDFAYKGTAISDIDNAAKWSDMLQFISKDYASLDDRFKPTNQSKIGCIDDSRTFFDLCKLIQDQQNNPTTPDTWDINPNEDEYTKIENYTHTYDVVTSNYAKNWFYFNTDSNQILQSLSDPKGNNSTFAYNGDILYASEGAGMYDPYDDTNMHVYKPAYSPLAMDMVVFNKKNDDADLSHKQKVYDVVKKFALEDADDQQGNIYDTDDDGNYIYGPMQNFDFIAYTDPLANINTYVLSSDGYFKDAGYTDSQIKLYQQIYNIDFTGVSDIISRIIENPLSDLAKSNMHWAYEPEKESIG